MNDAFLTLYFIRASGNISWRSPSSLTRDIIKNKLYLDKRFMGHVIIELSYLNKNNKRIYRLTGMAAKKINALKLLLIKKIGFGVLFHSFDGRLETQEELKSELKKRLDKPKGCINYIKYKINLATAERVDDYLSQFKKFNINKYYGLIHSPLHREGAGCSAFAVSILSVAGILEDQHIINWSNSVKIPLNLIGEPVQNKKISLFSIFFRFKGFAKENEAYKEIYFWDPYLMHQWVQQKIDSFHKYSDYIIDEKENTEGISFNLIDKEPPTVAIFKGNNDIHNLNPKKPDLTLKSNSKAFFSIT